MIRGWRAVGQNFGSCRSRSNTPKRPLSGHIARIHTSTPLSFSRQRVQSRVLETARNSWTPHRWKHTSRSSHNASSLSNQEILQSAFPTKTVIFLVVLGGLIYYAGKVEISILSDPPLIERVNQAHGDSFISAALQEYKDAADLNNFLAEINVYRRPPYEAYQGLYGDLEIAANGWMMSEDEARDFQMPVTHGCRMGINPVTEDFFALGTAPGPGSQPWKYWGIYDGHAGMFTSQNLQWLLIPYVSRALCSLPATQTFLIDQTIQQAFLQLDNDIMAPAKHAGHWSPAASANAIPALVPAFSGSCALLSAYDPQEQKLRVACVGDSRAVLGRWDSQTQSYTCVPLSEDQTGFNPKEVARIQAEHPDEPDILDKKTGRLMGLAVTRAFGDHRWKWDNDFIKQLQMKFWGPAPRPQSKTPPYMSAEPVITETDITSVPPPTYSSPSSKEKDGVGSRELGSERRERSDFLILASDGLWDRISSEHAIECVQRWLEAKDRGNGIVHADPQLKMPDFPPPNSPLDPSVTVDVEAGKEVDWKATPEFFAIEDENAAICLLRNAMGGTRRSLAMGILSTLNSPQARNAIDDTTIMVVFFDKVPEKDEKQVKKEEGRKWWPWKYEWERDVVEPPSRP